MGDTLQIDQLPTVKVLERQVLIEAVLQHRNEFVDICLRVQIA